MVTAMLTAREHHGRARPSTTCGRSIRTPNTTRPARRARRARWVGCARLRPRLARSRVRARKRARVSSSRLRRGRLQGPVLVSGRILFVHGRVGRLRWRTSVRVGCLLRRVERLSGRTRPLCDELMFDQYVRAGFPDPDPLRGAVLREISPGGNRPLAPLFHVVQGAWTLLTSPTRMSVSSSRPSGGRARVTAARAPGQAVRGLLRSGVRSSVPRCPPIVQAHLGMVMAELLLTGLMYAASLMFALYLESPTFSRSIAFGALATAAVLTKGNAWALATVPLLVILFTRRWSVLRRSSFYCGALPVVLVGVPWQMATARMAAQGWDARRPPSVSASRRSSHSRNSGGRWSAVRWCSQQSWGCGAR